MTYNVFFFRQGKKIRDNDLDQSRGDRTWDYIRENKMGDNVHVAMDSSGDQFIIGAETV